MACATSPSPPPKKFDPCEWYHFSEFCIGQISEENSQNQEIIFRLIISKIYYSALIAARDSANLQPPPKGMGVHQQTIEHYTVRNTYIANQLKVLRRCRSHCDYHIENEQICPGECGVKLADLTIRNLNAYLAKARQVLEKLGKFSSTPVVKY